MNKELLKKILSWLLAAGIGSGVTIKITDALSVKCVPVAQGVNQ